MTDVNYMRPQKEIFIPYILLIISSLSLLCVFYLNATEYARIKDLLRTSILQHRELEREISSSMLLLCAEEASKRTEDRQMGPTQPHVRRQISCRHMQDEYARIFKAKHVNEVKVHEIEESLQALHGINLVFLLLLPVTFAVWRTVVYIRLVRERKKLYIDSLTGVYNRRYLERTVMEYEPDYLVMLDLDDFKQINDTHGHLVGDAILISFTEQLRKSLRETDIIIRFGGDEFIVLLYCIEFNDARTLVERLRYISRHSIVAKNDQRIALPTFSVGLAKYEVSVENTIQRADASLYKVKQAGKNGFSAAN